MASKAEPPTTSVERHTVIRDGQEFIETREGLARILSPAAIKDEARKGTKEDAEAQKVFYNPIQQFNRDLTVLAIKAYGEDVIARRQKSGGNRINKRKRKTPSADEERPPKHGKSQVTGEDGSAAATAAAAGEVPEARSEPVVASETQDGQAATGTRPTTDDIGAESNGGPADDSAQPTRGDFKSGQGQERKAEPPRFTILDALSATGLRAMRYVKELPFVTSVTANDLTASAVEAIKRNAEHNGVGSRVNATQSDARAHMYSIVADDVTREHANRPSHFRKAGPSKKYDVIDLDPYGTAAPFFDAAVNAVRDDGGLLCVTCTDSGVWASHGYSEKAFALYGGIPIKGFHSHEGGLRLILNGLATTAAKQGLTIEPLLSLSIDYYVRIFVRVKKSPASVKFLAGRTMMVYSCDHGCGAWETQLLLRNKKIPNSKGSGHFYKHGLSMGPTTDQSCQHCGSRMHIAGPMYAGPLHSADFVNSILRELPNASKDIYGTTSRIEGMLSTALEELSLPLPPDRYPAINDDDLATLDPYPFFFHPVILSGAVHCTCPDEDSVRGALRGLGYEVTRSHCKPGSLKTNAPWSIIWHVMREWVRQKAPVKQERIKENSAAYRLLRLGPKGGPAANGNGAEAGGESKDADGSQGKDDAKKDGGNDVEDDGGNNGGNDDAKDVDKLEVVFDKSLGHDKSRKGLVRYQMNPKENWGPLSRAKG